MDLKILDGRGSFYQWDLNQKLLVEDDRVEHLHFPGEDENALVCPVYEYEGVRVANVPNILLQTAGDLRAFAVAGGRTMYCRIIKVNPREKPDDYIYTETEVWTAQKAVEEALQEAKERGELQENAVSYSLQELTPEQQAQARQNIGAVGQEQLDEAIENIPGGSGSVTAGYVATRKAENTLTLNVVPNIPLKSIFWWCTEGPINDTYLSIQDGAETHTFRTEEYHSAHYESCDGFWDVETNPSGPCGYNWMDGIVINANKQDVGYGVGVPLAFIPKTDSITLSSAGILEVTYTSSVPEGFVCFTPQELGEKEKTQARQNIGALGKADKILDAVIYSPQELTEEQQAQVRENINAASKTDVEGRTAVIGYDIIAPTIRNGYVYTCYNDVVALKNDTSAPNCACTEIIPVRAGEKFKISGRYGFSYLLITEFDQTNNILGYGEGGYTPGVVVNATDFEYTVPEGVFGIAVTSVDTKGWPIIVKRGCYGSLADDVVKNALDIMAINKRIDELCALMEATGTDTQTEE